MSDCRYGVSPVNYPDPDPDPEPKTNLQAQTHSLKLYEEAVIESEARTTAVQLKSEA